MLNAAVIGLGWWGRYIINSLEVSEKIKLTRAIDVNIEAAQDLAEQYDINLSGDLQDALDDDTIDFYFTFTSENNLRGQKYIQKESRQMEFDRLFKRDFGILMDFTPTELEDDE